MAETSSATIRNGRGEQHKPVSSQLAQACRACHARKVKCDLASKNSPPCSRCSQLDVPCQRYTRRLRTGRILQAVLEQRHATGRDQEASTEDGQSRDELEDLRTHFSSLGIGDTPRALVVPGLGDMSQRSTILVDFLSQNFSQETISDYQVTFNDDYSNVTRVLAREFGQGFTEGVYHHRDAPFIKRSAAGLPRTLDTPEQGVLELQGAFYLPKRDIADAFVRAFLDRIYPLMPVIEKDQFLRHYHATENENPSLSLLLLQSILVSGSTTYRHPDLALPPSEVSGRLFVRAKALVESRFEQDRLTLVQAHLLFSTFASDSCDDTIQNMWLSIGTAVRIAQGIGMHRSLGRANASPAMRRHWKRIWWSLFVHDTLCSFEWGRPRAIHLDNCDVELLTIEDLIDTAPGGLPNTEHAHLFRAMCDLCLIIADWLDLLKPSRFGSAVNYQHRQTNSNREAETAAQSQILVQELYRWHADLRAVLQPPLQGAGFTLWSATLHITYCAALLRFEALVPGHVDTVHQMAGEITKTGCDLMSQGLISSLWTFGIHEIDLAMGQHARQANSQNSDLAAAGLRSLQTGLPLLEHLSDRNSVASQGAEFYRVLIEKVQNGEIPSPSNPSGEQLAPTDESFNCPSDGLVAGHVDSFVPAVAMGHANQVFGHFNPQQLEAANMAHFDGQLWNWDLNG